LEWGAGQSTVWWAARAETVESYDDSTEWTEHVRSLAPGNVSIETIDVDVGEVRKGLARDRYDVIVVDGLDRLRCAEISVDLVSEDGCIIVDNSDGYWGPEGEYPIMELMRARGFERVDFYGYAPGVLTAHCTSICYRPGCFLTMGTENPYSENNR